MNLSSRVTQLNHAKEDSKGRYVLYWMQMFKRASHNYALNFAIQMANDRRLPLVVYEGLKFYYPLGQRSDPHVHSRRGGGKTG